MHIFSPAWQDVHCKTNPEWRIHPFLSRRVHIYNKSAQIYALFFNLFKSNYYVIIYILNILLYRPIRKILIQRKERVSNLEENIDTMNMEAQDKDNAYASGIQEARSKGLGEKESLLQAAAAEEREIIEKINQKAQADLAAVKEKIAKDTETVRESLQQEIDTFANAISERILGRSV